MPIKAKAPFLLRIEPGRADVIDRRTGARMGHVEAVAGGSAQFPWWNAYDAAGTLLGCVDGRQVAARRVWRDGG